MESIDPTEGGYTELKEFYEENAFFECFRHERRTAMSLWKKGLIVFGEEVPPEKDDEFFMAALTNKGLDVILKARRRGGK